MIYLGCSNKALEEILKRYNGEPFKISFYPEMLLKSLEILIGFDCLDIENKVTIYSRTHGKSCEVLPIDSLIISYILHSLNDFPCDAKLDEIKDKINFLKIYCSPSSFTKIKDFILYLENINIEHHKYSDLF
jgi:DNA polymerase III sliding clamp (beta) subunit (PCNA family)